MSGHSKWENIKRKKGATDAARAKIFTKIGREIAVVVKQGGADPAGNAKLRDLIAKAKSNNVPNDNIDRIIKKAAGDGDKNSYEYTRATVQAVLLLSLSALQTTRTEQQAISVTSSTSSAETWVHQAVYLSCSLTLVLLLWRTTVLTRTR